MNDKDINHSELVDLEARLRRLVLPDGGMSGSADHRVLARVQGYVRDHPGRGARDWGRLLLTIGAVAVPVAAAAAIAAIVLLGHGVNATRLLQPAASPVPNASASPTAAALQTVIVEVSTPPSQVGPQTVHWVTSHGTELASRLLPDKEAILGAGGSHVLVYRSDGHVLDLHMDGSSQDVGSGMPASTAPGPASVPVRALVSPDGTQWIWGEIVARSPSGPGYSVTSTITLAGIGAAPRTVARVVEDNRALEPYRWVLANPLINHGGIGVGGYLLFDYSHGAVDQLDLSTGRQTPVGTSLDSVADLAANGATAYIENTANGTPPLVTISGPGQRGLGATLPATGQAGGLMFDPYSTHLVFATSPGNGPPHERFETDILDLNSGARTRFGPADLRPAVWLPDGRLIEFRTTSDGDGVPGTYLVSLDGSASRISGYSQVVGYVQLAQSPTARCHTSDLEVHLAASGVALGNIPLLFEVRNKSNAACVLNGYFGVAAVDASGHVFVDAQRNVTTYFGSSNPPHEVVLPAGTATLHESNVPANLSTFSPISGHAYFLVGYGHGCNGGAPTGGDRLRLIPPDQTQSITLPNLDPTMCSPVVTPVDGTSLLKTP